MPIPAPTSHSVVRFHSTRMGFASTDGLECAFGRRGYCNAIYIAGRAPADHRAVRLHRTGMRTTGTYSLKGAAKLKRLTMIIIPPTGYRPICPHPAGVIRPSADRQERTFLRRGFSIIVITPANNHTVCFYTASVRLAGTYRNKGVRRRPRSALAVAVVAATNGRAIRFEPAGMLVAHTYKAERVVAPICRSSIPISFTPTMRSPMGSYSARVLTPRANRPVIPLHFRQRLTVRVGAPAGDAAVALDAAGVPRPRADSVEQAVGRSGLPVMIIAPAFHPPVLAQPAAVLAAGSDGGERCTGRSVQLAVFVAAPALGGSVVGAESAGVGTAGVDVRERHAGRGGGLAVFVIAPACRHAGVGDAAGVFVAGGDGGESYAGRRGGLAFVGVAVGAPADGGGVGLEHTGVLAAGSDSICRVLRRRRGRRSGPDSVAESGPAGDLPAGCRITSDDGKRILNPGLQPGDDGGTGLGAMPAIVVAIGTA